MHYYSKNNVISELLKMEASMRTLLVLVLLTLSFSTNADGKFNFNSGSIADIQERQREQQDRMRETKELRELKESNKLTGEQLRRQKDQLIEEQRGKTEKALLGE